MKKLTNDDVITLATVQVYDPKFTFLSATFRNVPDYDVQKCVRDNEPVLKAESQKIHESLIATFGEKYSREDIKVREILNKESELKLSKIKITEDQFRGFRPNWNSMFCSDFIFEIKPKK
jgi:hypothetical protein